MLENLKVEITIETSASPDQVWDALVNPAKIKLYLFGTDAISDWKKGASIRFVGTWEGKQYEDKGTILRLEKNKVFEYNYWSSFSPLPDKPENYSTIAFEIKSGAGSTVLSLVQSGFAGEAQRSHSEENWTRVLEQLKAIAEAG